MRILLSFLLLSVFSAAEPTDVPNKERGTESAISWQLDKAHSSVNFEIRHFFTPVHGTFRSFEAELDFDPDDLASSRIAVTIDVSSVDTNQERRDKDLLSDSFFDVEKYPEITFVSESIESTGENTFVAHGRLKVRDVERDFDLPFTLLGIRELPPEMAERMGTTAISGFSSQTSLNRTDYGVGTGRWTETAVVGDEVGINIAIEARRK